ncbi:fimbria/pilus periplasmic chaperone [Providencia sp. PROV012]|uniref:fimbria/pilus periplasmic chaperone n=1 Tax=Providencia sp. PROV012 TaxID=2936772 RepID=UPI0013DF299C|nr:molecular chaperone [Providencia sp. 1701091]
MDKYSNAMSLCRGVTIIWCGLLWGCLLSGMTAQANELDNQAGIALQSTRVIYTGNAKKGISFTVTNNTSNVYLLQSRVLPWSNGGMDP